MLIYDKSGRELRHRILLSFFVVEILSMTESVARLDLQMVISSTSKLVDFLFLSVRHIFGRILAKSINQGGGVAAVVFEMKRLKKSNIQISLFRFKTMEMQKGGGYKFVPGKMFSGIKCEFSRVLLDFRG